MPSGVFGRFDILPGHQQAGEKKKKTPEEKKF